MNLWYMKYMKFVNNPNLSKYNAFLFLLKPEFVYK